MTENLFFFLHDQGAGVLNTPQSINVNFDEDPNDNTRGIITGVSITTSDFFNQDLEQLLSQIETITLRTTFAGLSTGIDSIDLDASTTSNTIELNIIDRDRRQGVNNVYFYFRVQPVTISPINATGLNFTYIPSNYENPDPSTNNLSTVSFTPTLNGITFITSDFNPLFSNASINRISTFNQVSDRNQFSNNPLNIDKLLVGSGSLAQIPDSNYSDTGLINARYEGSKTTTQDFGGIEPALSGRTFNGVISSDQLSFVQAESASVAEGAVVNELFHTGNNTLPEFRLVSSSIVATSGPGTSGTSFTFSNIGYGENTGSFFDVGNILIASNEGATEKLRIESINSNVVTIERNYDKSLSSNLNIDSDFKFKIIIPTRIFKFDENSNNIIAVDNSQIFVKESTTVLTTDRFGLVLGGSVTQNNFN